MAPSRPRPLSLAATSNRASRGWIGTESIWFPRSVIRAWGTSECAQQNEQAFCGCQSVKRRLFKPSELGGIDCAPGVEGEDRCTEVDAMDFRLLEFRDGRSDRVRTRGECSDQVQFVLRDRHVAPPRRD